MRFDRVAIIGTGLLGASLGLALKKRGLAKHVIGVARRQIPLDQAMALGAFDEALVGFEPELWNADLIILCTPVRTIIQQLEQLEASISAEKEVMITEVGSTKATIVKAAETILSNKHRFIGSHPMAGGEKQGPESAHADLFEGRPVVITKDHVTESDLTLLTELWTALGMRVLKMTAQEHDRAVAAISHAPHAASVALVELAAQWGALSVASTGFASQTRLAEGHESLWSDIFLENKHEVVQATRALATQLNELADQFEQGDADALTARLRNARELRVEWMKLLHESPESKEEA